MKMNRTRPVLSAFSISLFTILSMLFFSCESSRVGPELPAPNPPVPAAQPLVLTGYVKNAADLTIIPGATVKIAKADATILATILTDNSGKYIYDATNLPENTLSVSANKDGYGFQSKIAELNKAANSATVSDILLNKIAAASSPVTVATGGTGSTTNTQSVASQPLTVSVPPNAVSAPITLTVAALPAAQVPQPTLTANSSVQSAGQFGPSGTQFQQPVTITFSLPSAQTVGKTFPLLQLNEQTGVYSNSGFTATVNAGGTTASAPVTHFTIYVLSDEATSNLVEGTTSTVAGSSSYFGLTQGQGTREYSSTNTYSATGTGTVSEAWLKDMISKKLSIDFLTTSTRVGGNFPTLPGNYQSNGVQTNPSVSGKGNWEYRWYVYKQSTPVTGTASGSSGTGWTRNISVVKEKWVVEAVAPAGKTGWYWSSHDQGGAVTGPY
ncbi:MAG: carboxypeptidase-like regulatory domain-containing protein [Melioribacteraceae bacterium]